ncbi:unnamed protein product [Rotaria socialis]|uniref:NHL repeat containing protein n=1 Tax=Rotaria socialis TaxID=392032 RepID=A0A820TG08_9BILA|nr:unnamed protein product [Rotaria socialis]CAF4471440.1 unnamed protein product [Rotaria socialis]
MVTHRKSSNRINPDRLQNVIQLSIHSVKNRTSHNQPLRQSLPEHKSKTISARHWYDTSKSTHSDMQARKISKRHSQHRKRRHRSHGDHVLQQMNNDKPGIDTQVVEFHDFSSPVHTAGPKAESPQPVTSHSGKLAETSLVPQDKTSTKILRQLRPLLPRLQARVRRQLPHLLPRRQARVLHQQHHRLLRLQALVLHQPLRRSQRLQVVVQHQTLHRLLRLQALVQHQLRQRLHRLQPVVSTSFPITWNSTAETIAGIAAGTAGVTANELYYPYGMALDSANSLYVADYHNNRIQKWLSGATNGTTIAGQSSGVAGASSSALTMPVAIVLDSANNMYFTDRGNHRVMYWTNGASSGTTIAGTTGVSGSANNQFYMPSDLTRIASTNTLYIADTFNNRIMRYLSGASSGTVVAGGNGAGNANTQLNLPFSFAFDSSSNSFIIANYNAHSVVRWVLGASSWTLIAGVVGSAGSTSTSFNAPLSVVLDSMNNMFIADTNNDRIQFFLAGQSNGTTIAGITGLPGTAHTQLNVPYWAIIDNQYNLYVADTFNDRVQKFHYY